MALSAQVFVQLTTERRKYRCSHPVLGTFNVDLDAGTQANWFNCNCFHLSHRLLPCLWRSIKAAPDRLSGLLVTADSGFAVGEVEVLVDSPDLVEQVTPA